MDDLLDLSWSDTPKAGNGCNTGNGSSASLGSLLQPKPKTPVGTGSSAFDMLSKPSANYTLSASSTRTSSPLPKAIPGLVARSSAGSGAASPASASAGTGASPAPSAGSAAGGDAFSSLLGLGASSKNPANLTMAERSAQLAAEKQRQAEQERSRWDHGDFWDKQMGGGAGLTPSAPAPKQAPTLPAPVAKPALAPALAPARGTSPASVGGKSNAGSFWDNPGLQPVRAASAASGSASPKPLNGTGAADTFDDLDGFLSAPAAKATRSAKPAAKAAPADPWDLDALSASVPATTDYADDYASEDDDLLGELGRPAKSKPTSLQSSGSARPPARAESPPPHVLGKIVEMGFSVDQARAALAATPTGLDVEAALDSLLNAGSGSSSGGRDRERERERDRDELEMDDERIAREMQAREDQRARHAARRAGPSRDSIVPEKDRQGDEFGDQTDRIMAQASEIGASMLSKATSFWNTGKERALKVYEEQRRAMDTQAAQKKRPADGRPRWMVEAEEAEAAASGAAGSASASASASGSPRRQGNGGFRDDSPVKSGFRDDDDDEPRAPAPAKARVPAPAAPANRDRLNIGNLFSDEPARQESPRGYVSKNRHLNRSAVASPSASAPSSASARRPSPAPAAPTPARELVPATPAQVSAAVQHKTTGNEHFKLGRYAEADAAYTAALAALPAGHIVLVTLHNNRAATRLKLGEGSTAVADCTAAIALIGPSYHPSKEAALPPGVDVKLGDALVKATVKRAQAHEMGEKWRLALEDWERVLGFDAALSPALAASKTQASEGVRRAKLALEGGSASASGSGSGSAAAAKPRPKPKPKPVRASTPADISKSAAVSEMRAAAAAAAKEDDERAALKDSVDARVEAWKEGKETNLRALIASLDSVLWEAALAGGLKVGMHELITDKQVKIKYMRVAARLHPDKLQVASTTVEQRMLAAGTFSVLSEAWAGFNA